MFEFADLPLVATPIGQCEIGAVSRAIQRVCHDRSFTNPRLIRQSMNAVYRVDSSSGPVIMRVSRATTDPVVAIEFARYLQHQGFAVPAPMTHRSFRHDEIDITLWEFIDSDQMVEPSWIDIGAMVRRLHDLEPEDIAQFYPLPLASSFPWWNFSKILGDLTPHLLASDLDVLHRCWERHRSVIESIASSNSWDSKQSLVVCHGDVHPGNVMVDRGSGRTLLIDWDLLCCAPPQWDHSALHSWSSRWGGASWIYKDFIRGYGVDFRQDANLEALAELRLLSATLMRYQAAQTDPIQSIEAQRRLMWWRGDPQSPMWQAI